MDKRFKNVMDKYCKHARRNTKLFQTYDILRAENEKLKSKNKKLQAKIEDREVSFLLEKTYVIYHMRMKTLEETKQGIANIDGCIAKALKLETITFNNIPARPTASSSSSSSSES